MKEAFNKFAKFYREQAVVLAIVSLILFLALSWWWGRRRIEGIRRNLLINCFIDCESQQVDKTGCSASCQEEYGKLK